MGPSLTGPPAGPPPSLQGVLDSVRLPAIVGLLVGRRLSGRLVVADGQRGGAIVLENGRLVAAVLRAGGGSGCPDPPGPVLPQGRFTFTPGHYATPAEAGPGLDAHTDTRLSALDLLTEVDRRRESLGPLLTAGWEPTPTGAAGGAPGGRLAARPRRPRGPDGHPPRLPGAPGDRGRRRNPGPAADGGRPGAPAAPAPGPSHRPPRRRAPRGELRLAPRPRPPPPPGPVPFVPSTVWQVVPAGTAVPPGGEYRLELGGHVYARWPASALAALSAVPPPGPPDAAPAPEPPAPDERPSRVPLAPAPAPAVPRPVRLGGRPGRRRRPGGAGPGARHPPPRV